MDTSLRNSKRAWQDSSGEPSPANARGRLWGHHWPLFTPPANSRTQLFLRLLGLLLLIYAMLGRTGAHIGLPLGIYTGVYIGDLVLLYGLAVLTVEGRYGRFFALPLAWLWLLFFAWNAAQTLPYFSEYGLVAVRDGAIWGYSLFAVIVASQLIARPSGFMNLLGWFGRFARLYVYFVLIMIPVSLYFYRFDANLNPIRNPLGLDPPTVTVLMPHVTGAMAFVACRLVPVPAAWWWALAVEVMTIGTQGRGALMGFLAAGALVWIFNPWSMRPSFRAMGMVGGLAFVLAVMLMLNLNLGVYRGRAIGPDQLLQNIAGTFAETGSQELDGPREGRLHMWNIMIDYTVFGPYFWTGKGYGINLVDDAGVVQVDIDPPLRTPENSHLTLLARSGVPGFLLWAVLQSTWAVGILRVLFFARRTGRRQTTGLMTFLLTYWALYMIYSTTNVVFEGPQGGIWFWTIFGVGAAAAHMVRRDADFFERMRLWSPLRRRGGPRTHAPIPIDSRPA